MILMYTFQASATTEAQPETKIEPNVTEELTAVQAKTEPEPVQAEPVKAEPEPEKAEPEPEKAEPEPVMEEAEPAVDKSEPTEEPMTKESEQEEETANGVEAKNEVNDEEMTTVADLSDDGK